MPKTWYLGSAEVRAWGGGPGRRQAAAKTAKTGQHGKKFRNIRKEFEKKNSSKVQKKWFFGRFGPFLDDFGPFFGPFGAFLSIW